MRTLIILIPIFLNANISCAQNLGFRGGLNISDQRYRIEGERVTDDSDPRFSIHFGVTYDRVISDWQGLTGELIYSAEGASGSGDQGVMRLNYLQLPLMYYYQWPSGLRLSVGPVFSYLLNARANSHGFGTDRRDAYENFMLSLGGDLRYGLGKGWSGGMRYIRGISDFLNREFYTFDLRSHTDTFQLYLAFTFKPL